MSLHTYTRAKKPGGWDIDNVDHVNAVGKQITLAADIKAAMPGKAFKVILNGTECKVEFTTTLTALEIAALDSTVSSHKAIVGTVHEDKVTRAAGREALHVSWAALGATYPYITGPFEHKFEECILLLDQGRQAEAEAVIEYAEAPSGYDATQLAVFAQVKADMLAGVQSLPIV